MVSLGGVLISLMWSLSPKVAKRQSVKHGQPQSVTAFDRYQVILLCDRGTQVLVACPMPLRNGAGAELEPATYKSQVRCSTDSVTTAFGSGCIKM